MTAKIFSNGFNRMIHVNRPLTNEAARKLMALDALDKEILTYEKLDEWYTAWGGQRDGISTRLHH